MLAHPRLSGWRTHLAATVASPCCGQVVVVDWASLFGTFLRSRPCDEMPLRRRRGLEAGGALSTVGMLAT